MRSLSYLALLLLAPMAAAQLRPAPAPPGNPLTVSKARLGKVLFWDEQLSSTGTVSCGTCHMPEAGGADPRSANSWNPGADGVFGTADDGRGSPGVPNADGSGHYIKDAVFGLQPQVTGRMAPSAIGAGYSKHLFWDGRAGQQFIDPETGNVVLASGAALESQAIGPILSSVEMGHMGRSWGDVTTRIQAAEPLALSAFIPATLQNWIAGRSYPALFLEAFGNSTVDAKGIGMAIASYERTLTPDQTPWDQVLGGAPMSLVLSGNEQIGLLAFLDPDTGGCVSCHKNGNGPVRFTDDDFHYIGVAPPMDDLGRFNVTGDNRDRGSFRTPDLRNVALRGPFMHDGSQGTLADVIEFYNRGGDFNAPNKHPDIRPLGMSVGIQRDILAFLEGALTDPRVAAGTFPFDHPSQYADSIHQPVLYGDGTPGSAGKIPEMVVLEPPHLGSGDMTLGIDQARGGAFAMLLLNTVETPGGLLRNGARLYPNLSGVALVPLPKLRGHGAGQGWGSTLVTVPNDPALLGMPIYAQWVVFDAGAPQRFAASRAVRWSWF